MKKITQIFKEINIILGKYFLAKKDNTIIFAKNFKNQYLTWPPKIKFRDNIQKFAGGMMTAVILLVIVGFFVGIGTGLSQLTTKGSFMKAVWEAFNTIGFKIMGFLPLWFCIGLSFSLSKSEKGWATLNAVFAFIAINALIGLWGSKDFQNDIPATKEAMKAQILWTNLLGMKTYKTGIFLGMIVGVWTAWIHNRSYKKNLPTVFAFFGGPKWPIIKMAFYVIPFTGIFYFAWPVMNNLLVDMGKGIGKAGLGGTFLFGAVDKALLPLGLHHLIAFPIEYSSVGGTVNVAGVVADKTLNFTQVGGMSIVDGKETVTYAVTGVRNIITMQASSLTETGYIVHNFTSGRILFQIGGYLGVATALILTSKKENKVKIASISIPAALTAAFVGVSEPIEYTFLFTAPALYFLIHMPLAGLSYVLTEVTNVSINGHALFFMIPNIAQPDKVHALSLLYLIPLYYVIYGGSFYAAIKYFNLNTPGRGKANDGIKLFTKQDYQEKKLETKPINKSNNWYSDIIEAFGGARNILSVENCATRLRVSVKESLLVKNKEYWVKHLKASGVVKSKSGAYQIIYGPKVSNIATEIREKLGFQ